MHQNWRRIRAGVKAAERPEDAGLAGQEQVQQDKLPSFREFDRPTRRGSLVPAAPPRHLKHADDEVIATTATLLLFLY